MRTTSESPLASLRPFIHRLRRRFAFSAALVAATGCGTNHGSPAQPLAISTPSLAGGDVGVF